MSSHKGFTCINISRELIDRIAGQLSYYRPDYSYDKIAKVAENAFRSSQTASESLNSCEQFILFYSWVVTTPTLSQGILDKITHIFSSLDMAKFDLKKRTDLLLTAMTKNAPELLTFLNNTKQLNVNDRDDSGQTPLHVIIPKGEKEDVAFFIKNGADVDAKDDSGKTPLYVAFKHNKVKIIRCLIKNGADIKARYENGEMLLHMAVDKDQTEVIKLLVDKVDLNATKDDGRTALHIAALRGNIKPATILAAEKEINVNAKDENGWTSLHLAVRASKFREEIVTLLLQNKANVDAKDNDGRTPLHLAVCEGRAEVVRLLIDNLADINEQDTLFGKTPLHLAVEKNRTEIIRLLLDHNADVNTIGRFGKTPLHIAITTGSIEIVRLLTDNGANVDFKDDFGETLHDVAAHKGNQEIITLLRENGACFNSKDENGGPASMHLERGRHHNDHSKVLCTEEGGKTFLHAAVQERNLPVIKFLLEHGAYVDAKDQYNEQTPLYIAAKKGDIGAVLALLEYDAKLSPEILQECQKHGLLPEVLIYILNTFPLDFIKENLNLLGPHFNLLPENSKELLTNCSDEDYQEILKIIKNYMVLPRIL